MCNETLQYLVKEWKKNPVKLDNSYDKTQEQYDDKFLEAVYINNIVNNLDILLNMKVASTITRKKYSYVGTVKNSKS